MIDSNNCRRIEETASGLYWIWVGGGSVTTKVQGGLSPVIRVGGGSVTTKVRGGLRPVILVGGGSVTTKVRGGLSPVIRVGGGSTARSTVNYINSAAPWSKFQNIKQNSKTNILITCPPPPYAKNALTSPLCVRNKKMTTNIISQVN